MEIERLPVLRALAAFALSLVLLVAMSPLAAAWLGALAIIQIVAIALPPLALARPLAARRLGLSWPRPAALAGSMLLGASTWWIVLIAVDPLVAALAKHSYLFDPARLAGLEDIVASTPWPVLVLSFMLAPAVCEELLFRGALGRALTGPLGSGWAIVCSALLFGLFHFEPIRMIPTALLGLVFGYAAIVTRSTVSAMVVHLVNNVLAIGFARLGSEGLDDHRLALTAAAGIAFLSGIALIWRTRPL